jgi:hypothetical protein
MEDRYMTELPNIDGEWRLVVRHRELAPDAPIYTVQGDKVTVSDGSAGTCTYEPGEAVLSIHDPGGEFSHGMRFDLGAHEGALSGYLRDAAVPTDYHTDCYFVRATPTER